MTIADYRNRKSATNNKPSETVSEAIRKLDGVAVANVDEPLAGDLERVLNENRELRENIRSLESFINKMNKYVLPGEIDSQDSALKVFKELENEVKRLKYLLREINKISKPRRINK